MGEFVIEAEQRDDQAAVNDVVRRAFAPVRRSPTWSPLSARRRATGLAWRSLPGVGHVVTGFVMLSGTDLVDEVPATYGRLGFEFAPAYGVTIELPDWVPREAEQVYLLSSYDCDARGRVEYPPEIRALSR